MFALLGSLAVLGSLARLLLRLLGSSKPQLPPSLDSSSAEASSNLSLLLICLDLLFNKNMSDLNDRSFSRGLAESCGSIHDHGVMHQYCQFINSLLSLSRWQLLMDEGIKKDLTTIEKSSFYRRYLCIETRSFSFMENPSSNPERSNW
jgi:hypothetical protein